MPILSTILGFSGLNKLHTLALAGLLISSTALGFATKHYYTKSVLKGQEIEQVKVKLSSINQEMADLLNEKDAKIASLQAALSRQKSAYRRIDKEREAMRSKIDALKNKSPEVAEYLATRIPDSLYHQLFGK